MSNRNLPEKNQICCGGHLSKPLVKLKAGSLSMIYEEGNIRYISAGRNEMIRMIYSAVRDKEWLTIKPEISDEKIEILPDSFRIGYHCNYRSGEINFSAWYEIEGKSDNSVIFSFEGEALAAFEKSRIGFCVLHPAEHYADKQCTITHSDGTEEIAVFPLYISPDQPFLDIKSMKWKRNGAVCKLTFSGDIFETEDQRNWTDDSYKTYCTPLRLPCPALVRTGQKISQRIELKVEPGIINNIRDGAEIRITVSPDDTFAFPLLGIGRSTRPVMLTENEIGILKEINFDNYRVDLYLFKTDWYQVADKANDEAIKLKYPLEFALFFDENWIVQSDDFISWVTDRQPLISAIMLFHRTESSTPSHITDSVAPKLKRALHDVRVGCGTNANFAQLNRQFPSSGFIDLVCYSIHPQEHASDNSTLVENLRAQSDSVLSARYYSGGMDIVVSR